MDVTQIYSIVNDAARQSMGQTAVAVQDLQGLISYLNLKELRKNIQKLMLLQVLTKIFIL